MNYYIIAGEASGDLHGSNLMNAIRKLDEDAHFRIWGGDKMIAEGGELVTHYREMSFMGFVEVFVNLRTILKKIRKCKQDLLLHRPDALILIDYPGFNLRIAQFAKKQGIRVFYYISPQVWAWKSSRVSLIKRVVEKMFVILPFEKDFFRRHNCEVEFVGHPLLDVMDVKNNNGGESEKFRIRNSLNEKPIVAILPGSRMKEIEQMLPVMLTATEKFGDYQFVVAAMPSVPQSVYKSLIGSKENVKIVIDKTHQLLKYSVAGLVTSGTATLETALFGVPEVVCYKASFLSYYMAKLLVNRELRYISLVNLILDHPVVKELIQKEFTSNNLCAELEKILWNTVYREKMKDVFGELRTILGGAGASVRVAKSLVEAIKKGK